jgi:hypothetical protein
MNWLVFGIVGGVAAWFEYNYQRSRHGKSRQAASGLPVPESAHVELAGDVPSISPGSENDKKLNTTA